MSRSEPTAQGLGRWNGPRSTPGPVVVLGAGAGRSRVIGSGTIGGSSTSAGSRVTHDAYFTFHNTEETKGNISVTEEDIRPLIAEMTGIFRWRSSLTYLH